MIAHVDLASMTSRELRELEVQLSAARRNFVADDRLGVARWFGAVVAAVDAEGYRRAARSGPRVTEVELPDDPDASPGEREAFYRFAMARCAHLRDLPGSPDAVRAVFAELVDVLAETEARRAADLRSIRTFGIAPAVLDESA